MNEAISSYNLFDLRRQQLGNEKEPTCLTRVHDGVTATRIDRFLIPTSSKYDDVLFNIHVRDDLVWVKDSTSDHKTLILDIETTQGEKGHSRPTIREDLVFQPKIQSKIMLIVNDTYKKGGSESKKWMNAMTALKSYLLDETNKRRKKDSIKIVQLRSVIEITRKMEAKDGATSASQQTMKELKKELFNLEHPEQELLAKKSAAVNMTERSDKCTKAFFRSYKAQAKQQWINSIKTANWQDGAEPNFTSEESEPKKIPNALSDYYKMLFSEKTINEGDMNDLQEEMKKQQVLPHSALQLDRPISKGEIQKVMDKLPLGKQAGPNRIPNGVYRVLSKFFAPLLHKVFKEARRKGQLPTSMLEGDITLLFKKNDRTDVRNYRPLTMLNTDYKIYTKILAERLKTVVHQFVAECQKGFVPKTFISECSMLIHLIEAWINDEPTTREGLFIFLDMEKAFDRVSFKFLLTSMKALGFGDGFVDAVKLMYDVDRPPKRRIYANGYYSQWFPIKSGVAQGCPLSPLLFLVVGQALKIAIDKADGVKGIEIKGILYKLSQFADDTTLLLGSLDQLPHAEEAIKKWCRATGMRENYKKREGLGMGRYRNDKKPELPTNIKWVEEGNWAVSLGVPVGNDLDTEAWWKQKLKAVRKHTSRWVGLFRSSYFGRNLIVQSMYFGRLRYWLFSLHMPPKLVELVQQEADILWWSREPDLNTPQTKRFKRFVAKKSAIGRRGQGGLGNMDWASHVRAFQAQWILRYSADPAASSWKTLLDTLLFVNEADELKFTEKRSIFFCKLRRVHRFLLVKHLPKGAEYIRQCISSFFDLKITQDLAHKHSARHISGESLWFNHRFDVKATNTARGYYANTIDTTLLSDIINSNTNNVFTLTPSPLCLCEQKQDL